MNHLKNSIFIMIESSFLRSKNIFMTLEMLREIPLFATLGPEYLADLLKQLQKENYSPHTIVFWMD